MPVIGRRAIPALRLHLPNKLKKFIAEFLFRNEILFSFSFHNFHFFNCETFFKPNPTGIRPAFVRTVPRRIQLLQQNREKNDCMQNTNYQTEPSISKFPSREGPRGVSRPSIATSNQNKHPKPTNRTSKNSSKNIPTAPLTVTHPFIPNQITHYQTESSIQNSPLESEVHPKSWTGYTLSGNGKSPVLYRALSL